MIVLLPFMFMAIFYVGKATVKILIGLFSLIAVTFAFTIKATNWIFSPSNKR